MMIPELRLPDDFEQYGWEVEAKGYFTDSSVVLGDRVVEVAFYDPTRLAQDIAEDLADGRPFAARHLLVVESVTPASMAAAVAGAPRGFFD
jgi:hypothetical protein